MTTIDYLEKQYEHSYEMVKFGESKNTTLIAFNGAIIVGMATIIKDVTSCIIYWYLIYVIVMCTLSIFVCFGTLIAKIKHTSKARVFTPNDNLLYYATLAQMGYEELITMIKELYKCESANHNHEIDMARQVIITSQIASRKFELFNLALAIMISGLMTPLSFLFYRFYFNPDK